MDIEIPLSFCAASHICLQNHGARTINDVSREIVNTCRKNKYLVFLKAKNPIAIENTIKTTLINWVVEFTGTWTCILSQTPKKVKKPKVKNNKDTHPRIQPKV